VHKEKKGKTNGKETKVRGKGGKGGDFASGQSKHIKKKVRRRFRRNRKERKTMAHGKGWGKVRFPYEGVLPLAGKGKGVAEGKTGGGEIPRKRKGGNAPGSFVRRKKRLWKVGLTVKAGKIKSNWRKTIHIERCESGADTIAKRPRS